MQLHELREQHKLAALLAEAMPEKASERDEINGQIAAHEQRLKDLSAALQASAQLRREAEERARIAKADDDWNTAAHLLAEREKLAAELQPLLMQAGELYGRLSEAGAQVSRILYPHVKSSAVADALRRDSVEELVKRALYRGGAEFMQPESVMANQAPDLPDYVAQQSERVLARRPARVETE